MAVKSERMNMTEGPLLKKIILYTLPVLATGVLQFLYNAADTAVVGRFAEDSETALAAVGSTGALTMLITGLFIGLSVGANVSVSHAFGAGREDHVKDIVHTAVSVSAILGVIIGIFGFFMAKPLLSLMSVPPHVLEQSSLYMRTLFLGLPAQMAYNYGAAILNARGDTKHPFYFLTAAGLLNVSLNLFFVIVCGMGVLGVAVATICAQYLSAFLVLRLLSKLDDCCHLDINHLYIRKDKLIKMIKIGLPAGVQGCLFSVSNVLIQSSINSFGSVTMAANTAAANIDGIIYISMNSFYHAAIAFAGQNAGAMKYDRVKKVCVSCLFLVSLFGAAIGLFCYFMGPNLLPIFGVNGSPETNEVMKIAMTRLLIVGIPYFICGMQEVMSGMLRGMGLSFISMTISLIGICLFRIIWLNTAFQSFKCIETIYMSYPVSWIIVAFVDIICFCFVIKNRKKQMMVNV